MPLTSSLHPIRTRFARDIVAEVLLPEKQTGRIIIFCSGLPASPSKDATLRFLAERGFVAILPRYRGTWESHGFFLQHSPFKDIQDIVEELSQRKKIFDLTTKKELPLKVQGIFVIGVSFGGSAALLASTLPQVRKVVAVSPVVDWKVDSKVDPFVQFVQSTQEEFGMAYRPRHPRDWQKLVRTDFYNPADHMAKCDGKKIFIIHAEDDVIVPISPSKKFIKQVGGSFYWKRVGGHTLRISHQFFWKKIEAFLKQK